LRGLATLFLALSAPSPGLPSLCADAFATIEPTLRTGPGVSLALPAAPALTTLCAQSPVRLVRMPAASGAIAPRNASFGPLAGSPVLGLAGIGIPDALDAGGLALAGSLPIGGTAFLETDRALAAAGLWSALTAPRAKPHRTAPLGAQAMALAILDASLEIFMGHWGRLPDM